MEVYTKIVDEKEFLFTLLTSREEISPTLVSWKRINQEFEIKIEKWPFTLFDLQDWNPYRNSAKSLIEKLHSLKIFHGDISEENLVVNPQTQEIKLIDFGRSKWIDQIDQDDLTAYSYRQEGVSNSVDQLLAAEIKEIDYLVGVHHQAQINEFVDQLVEIELKGLII